MAYAATPIEQRFWPKVDKRGPDECWPWKAAKLPKGYGKIYLREERRMVGAHRVSWEIANGKPIPRELVACHRCDNPSCVNPDHIFIGSTLDNMRDAVAKGRGSAVQRRDKTHCVNGHLRTPETLRFTGMGRQCKPCERERAARRRAEAKARRHPR